MRRSTFTLYEPANPRSEVITRTAARCGFCRSVSSGWSSDAEDASAESTRVISRAYGLEASTRAWARTMRAPAISS